MTAFSGQFPRFTGGWDDLTPADQTLVRMLRGATFTGGTIVLPSGRSVTPEQMTTLTGNQEEQS